MPKYDISMKETFGIKLNYLWDFKPFSSNYQLLEADLSDKDDNTHFCSTMKLVCTVYYATD